MSVWNLVDLLIRCIEHPSAPGLTPLAADDDDVALPDLVRMLAEGMGKRPRLLNVPERILRLGASAVGMQDSFEKLAGTLQVDASETRRLLHWTPPMSLREGLTKTAKWYVETRNSLAGI